ncbi:DUF7689 domain-containing protein [Bradyrhizobium elkanii]|uniref:DUF7689 domain-containing protein n=1 Tax=Bradyrhizobium elkanii TaxID=29448 RepID=UPI00272B089E|nr:hypothetical protein [Bradyrhizobium elkanii]WLA78991.1 hypothetical protein QNJ99_26640 [Bradyrhizobium elkanii]
MDERYKADFPSLSNVADKKTSESTTRYNCIAWAFEDNRKHWWPNHKRSFWPMSALGQSAMGAFEKWFEADGWEICSGPEFEPGFKKIALYGIAGQPTHAARQLASGLWTSKLGNDIDLSHTLVDLVGPKYGMILRFYRKQTTPLPASVDPEENPPA